MPACSVPAGRPAPRGRSPRGPTRPALRNVCRKQEALPSRPVRSRTDRDAEAQGGRRPPRGAARRKELPSPSPAQRAAPSGSPRAWLRPGGASANPGHKRPSRPAPHSKDRVSGAAVPCQAPSSLLRVPLRRALCLHGCPLSHCELQESRDQACPERPGTEVPARSELPINTKEPRGDRLGQRHSCRVDSALWAAFSR